MMSVEVQKIENGFQINYYCYEKYKTVYIEDLSQFEKVAERVFKEIESSKKEEEMIEKKIEKKKLLGLM